MEIKTAVLADTANVSQEGKLNITGIFNQIQSGSFPVTWPSMVLVVRLEAHSSEIGSHKITIQITDEDGGKLATIQGNLDISGDNDPEDPPHGHLILPIQNAKFSKPGVYSFDILIDGRYEDSARLLVRERRGS